MRDLPTFKKFGNRYINLDHVIYFEVVGFRSLLLYFETPNWKDGGMTRTIKVEGTPEDLGYRMPVQPQ